MRLEPKPTTLSYELIPRDSLHGHRMYALLDGLLAAHHADVADARIALAWALRWKPDADGIVKLGQCRKASELDRQLHDFDFIILIRKAFWLDLRVEDPAREALLDHELCHCGRKVDDGGHPVEDEHGRPIYRIRKHDIEEFTEIVQRHGTYKQDLQRFATALQRQGVPAFQPCEACAELPGWMRVEVDGVSRLSRCACYLRWAEWARELRAS